MGKARAISLLASVTAAFIVILAAIAGILDVTLSLVFFLVFFVGVGLLFVFKASSSSRRKKESTSRRELLGLEIPKKFVRGRPPVYGRGHQIIPTRSTVEELPDREAPKSADEREIELEEEG
jgi:hypothetical protein